MTHRDVVNSSRSRRPTRSPATAPGRVAIGLAAGLAAVAAVAFSAPAAASAAGARGSVGAAEGSSASTGPRAPHTVSPQGHPREAASDCMPLDEDPDEAEGSLVVLVDGTMSSADQADRIDSIVQLVDDTTLDRTVSVAVGSFGGSDAEVRFDGCLDGDVFVPDGNNARTRERNRPDLIEGLDEVVTGLTVGYESSDPTSALRAGVQRLAEGDGETKVLVVHTDGIPTTGCAALPEQVAVDEPGLVERLTTACIDSGQLPSADGVDVVIGGIGRTDTADGRGLGADAVTFLLALNTALCEATGATCHVDANLPTDAWPAEAEED